MYDSESAGSRLLDRLRLGVESQRLILVATAQSLRYDDIKDAAEIQFPEHRQTPPVVYTRDFDRDDRHDKSNQPRDGNGKGYQGQRPQQSKGQPKGKGHPPSASTFTRKTYVTEDANANAEDDRGEADADAPEDSNEPNDADECEAADDDQPVQDGDDDDDGDLFNDLQEAARCLTVTARRLQGIKLGRKFTGGGKTIAQRKQESHCSVCGIKGHWQGDHECPATASKSKGNNGKGSGKSAQSSSPSTSSSTNPAAKKVLQVLHSSGSRRSVSFDDEKEFGTNFFTYMVTQPIAEIHQVFGANVNKFNGVMVLDTACQKSCCSTTWMDERSKILRTHGLRIHTTENCEPFEFGHGPPQYSYQHALIPACFDFVESNMMLLGTSVISTTNDIPFLASNNLMSNKLKMILNLPGQEAYLGLLDVTVPICKVAGHLALDITKFPENASKSEIWKRFHAICLEPSADSDLLHIPADGSSNTQFAHDHPPDEQGPATEMAVCVAEDGPLPSRSRDAPAASDDPSCAVRNPAQKMVGSPGSTQPGSHRGHSEEGTRTMQPREHTEVRQQARKLCQVPHVRQEVEMGSRARQVDRPTYAKAAIAALALIINGLYVHGEAPQASMDSHDSSFSGFTNPQSEHWSQFLDFSESFQCGSKDLGSQSQGSQKGSSSKNWNSQAHQGERGDRVRGRSVIGLRMGPDRHAQTRLKHGTQVWLTGHLRGTSKIYNQEISTYESMITHAEKEMKGPKIDLLEIFAGKANLTFRAPRHGLSALEPIDREINLDLYKPEDRRFLWQVVDKFKPLLIAIAWPCKFWSLFNEKHELQPET